MNKRIITLIIALASVCGGAVAQPKVSGRVPTREKRGYDQQIVIDTASVRVLYALNAKDIKDENTYIDLGKLEVGRRVKKYSSEFIDLSDEEAVKWKKKTGHTGYVPKSFWIGGRPELHENWSELVFSDYFIRGNELKEYACFPLWAERENSSYTEPWPLMQWSLADDQQTILGHRCQKATCRFRGRDFVAWFATDVPIKGGPWKFGGLPGLIVKVYDTDHLYTFECTGVERVRRPMVRSKYARRKPIKRETVLKLERKINENPAKTLGWKDLDGNALSKVYPYEPLELE